MLPADLPPHLPVPVSTECVAEAAERTGVSFLALATVLAVEAGEVGQMRANRNGTYDYGPMQINSVRVADLERRFTVDRRRLRWDGCYNVAVGAFVLAEELRRARDVPPRKRLAVAIGNYHSRTPHLRGRYLRRAFERAVSLLRPGVWDRLLAKINRRIGARSR